MLINRIERLIVNSPLRAMEQRLVEGPLLGRMASRDEYPLCLEIGCGRGVGAAIIARRFKARKVIATDADPRQVERAWKKLKPELRGVIEFRVGDAMDLEEPDGKFDGVFSFGVLHHMEDWRKAAGEIARVLKAGGELFFVEALKPFLRNVLVHRLTSHPPGGMFTFDELRDELAGRGVRMSASRQVGEHIVLGVGKKGDRPYSGNKRDNEAGPS